MEELLNILPCSPTVAVMQWKNEIAAHTDGLKVLVWHGSSRESNFEELQKYDVVCLSKLMNDQSDRHNLTKVLTTYSVMERYAYPLRVTLWFFTSAFFSCFRKQQSGFKRKGMIIKEKSPIHQVHWNRIVVSFSSFNFRIAFVDAIPA